MQTEMQNGKLYQIAHHTIQCSDPKTGKIGCWLYEGTDYRTPDTRISPVFNDLVGLFAWMDKRGWFNSGLTYKSFKEIKKGDKK